MYGFSHQHTTDDLRIFNKEVDTNMSWIICLRIRALRSPIWMKPWIVKHLRHMVYTFLQPITDVNICHFI